MAASLSVIADSGPPPGRPAYRQDVAVHRSWQTPEGRWIVDQVVDEPGVEFRLWDEGVLAAEAASPEELDRLLAMVGVRYDKLRPMGRPPGRE